MVTAGELNIIQHTSVVHGEGLQSVCLVACHNKHGEDSHAVDGAFTFGLKTWGTKGHGTPPGSRRRVCK